MSRYELTEDDREALFTAGNHHPDHCDCTAFADEVGYGPGSEICDGLDDTYRVVERIVADRMAWAWSEGLHAGAPSEPVTRQQYVAWKADHPNPYQDEQTRIADGDEPPALEAS